MWWWSVDEMLASFKNRGWNVVFVKVIVKLNIKISTNYEHTSISLIGSFHGFRSVQQCETPLLNTISVLNISKKTPELPCSEFQQFKYPHTSVLRMHYGNLEVLKDEVLRLIFHSVLFCTRAYTIRLYCVQYSHLLYACTPLIYSITEHVTAMKKKNCTQPELFLSTLSHFHTPMNVKCT